MTSEPPPSGASPQDDAAKAQATGRPASSSFFRWLRGLDLTRSSDRWLGGVAGALARRTGLDLALVRGLIVVLAVLGGIGVLLYGLAWALLPEPDGRIHVEQAGRGSWTSGLSGAAAMVALGLWRPDFPFLGDGDTGSLLWSLFWMGAVVLSVYWIVNRSEAGPIASDTAAPADSGAPDTRTDGHHLPASSSFPSPSPPGGPSTGVTTSAMAADDPPSTLPYDPASSSWSYGYPLQAPAPFAAPFPVAQRVSRRRPPRPSGSATALLLGSAILLAGTLLALDHTGLMVLASPSVVALAAAAAVLALGVIVLGIRGRTSGLVGFTAAMATAAALVISFAGTGGAFIVAQQTSDSPTSLRTAGTGFSVVAAEATLDLTALPAPETELVIPVNALVSDVTVVVPDDVPVEVRTRMALGSAGAVGTPEDVGEPPPSFDDDGDGFLRLTVDDLNPAASGPAFVLDIDGALSDVSIVTSPATRVPPSSSTSTGDLR